MKIIKSHRRDQPAPLGQLPATPTLYNNSEFIIIQSVIQRFCSAFDLPNCFRLDELGKDRAY